MKLAWELRSVDCMGGGGLETIADGTVDALVTDPPAGIGFMGKDWDSNKGGRVSWVAWLESVARECFRVMKPGAHGVVWALPRTSHWTATALEQAGFEVRDVITHHFGTGFPKSLNVSKAIDKARDDRASVVAVTAFVAAGRDAVEKTNKDIDEHLGTNGMAGHWTSTASQPAVPTPEQWLTLKEFLDLSDEMDSEVARLNDRKGSPGEAFFDRPVLGSHPNPAGNKASAGTYMMSIHGMPEEATLTGSALDAAKKWEGWGTALKPASEHWILIRKPLSGTVAANVQEHGTGALNIDATRIVTTENPNGGAYGGEERHRDNRTASDASAEASLSRLKRGVGEFAQPEGRWPANLVLSHSEWCGESGCLPGCPVALLDAQSGISKSIASAGVVRAGRSGGIMGKVGALRDGRPEGHVDAGGASRFFYVSKPTTGEREENIRDLPKRSAGELVDRSEGSAGMSNPRAGAGRTSRGRANIHPTVKSIELMSWLIKLVTPPGGLVLDPFTGSGTTGVAALRLGYRFLGWERDRDYHRIATARIERALRGMQMGLAI